MARTSTFQDDKFWTKHNSERTQARLDRTSGHNHCSACGATLNPETAKMVHIVDGGVLVLHPDDEEIYEDNGGDMGCWTSTASTSRVPVPPGSA